MEIDCPRYNMKYSCENVILGGKFHVVSCFHYISCYIAENLDYWSDSVTSIWLTLLHFWLLVMTCVSQLSILATGDNIGVGLAQLTPHPHHHHSLPHSLTTAGCHQGCLCSQSLNSNSLQECAQHKHITLSVKYKHRVWSRPGITKQWRTPVY